MTFGAMAAWQAWALLGAAGLLAAGLFLIKLRAPRMLVPSLLLWRRVLDEARERSLWERIRRAVSLVLTILVALLLAAAVVRPARSAGAAADPSRGRLVVVIDSSWSMQARTQSGESRWERALAEARRLFAAAPGSEMALATTAEGLVEGPTTDAALLDAALDRLQPMGGDRTAWPHYASAAAVHFITDGATMRPIDPDVTIHSVFEAAPNVAILAFDVRPSLTEQDAGDAYIEVANFAVTPQSVRVTLARGAATVYDQRLDVAASGVLRQVVPVPRGGDAALRARIHAEHDALALDDEAVAWIERSRPLAVTVVGTDPGWLRTALERNPDVNATYVQPSDYEQVTRGRGRDAEALVFDRWAPPSPPALPALLFAPPAGTPWLAGGGPAGAPGVPSPAPAELRPRWEAPGSHPVLHGVDPYTLVVDRAHSYGEPALVPIAASIRGTPLVHVRQDDEQRVVLVTFGPGDSNVVEAPAFPVLLANALEWLARPSPLLQFPPGARVRRSTLEPGLAAFVPAVRAVTDPRGRRVPLVRTHERALGLLEVPGLYAIDGAGFRTTLAVNAGDAELSNLRRTTMAATSASRAVAAGSAGRPWWVYCAVIAFGLILAEWWTWQRRITV